LPAVWLRNSVSAPVSRSRALYWRAEAARALGDTVHGDAGRFAAALGWIVRPDNDR
jgi:hypothetical protein